MSRFTTTELLNNQVFVVGTDRLGNTGQVVLDSSEWNDIKGHENYVNAAADFDAAVEEFFSELTEAAEKVQATLAQTTAPDPASYVVLHEGTPAVEGQPTVVRQLSTDSIILRLIEQGDTDRLVWVGDQLQVLASGATLPTPSTVPDASQGFEVPAGS